MNINDENEDEDLDDIVDSEEDGSKQQDASDKVQDINDKANDIKDLVERIKNNSNKSASPEGPTTKSSSKEASNNSSNNNAESQSGGNTSANASNTNSGKSNSNGTNTGTSNNTGTENSAVGGMNTATGNGANASNTAGANVSNTAGANVSSTAGANVSSTVAGETAAGGTAVASGGAAAGGAAAAAVPAGLVILIIIVVIILLIVVIGFVSFFTDGIGLIGGKLLEFANDLWKTIKYTFVDKSKDIDPNQIIDICNYLEEMGYDLEGYGFLNSNGDKITKEDTFNDDGTGKRTIKNSKGEIILERDIKKSEGGEIKEGEITSVKSDALWSYLVAENRSYLLTDNSISFESLFFDGDGNAGVGMIDVDAGFFGLSNLSVGFNVEINRENNQMILTKDGYKYAYNIDGWVGKYGKPLEFLLTLHLATMAPEFAKKVATSNEFNTRVVIGLDEVKAKIMVVDDKGEQITAANHNEKGVDDSTWQEIQKYNGTNNIKEITTYTPYIKRVENHWLYESIEFLTDNVDVYEFKTNYYYASRGDSSDTNAFTYMYEYEGLGKDDDPLVGKNLYIKEIRDSNMVQKEEPRVTKRAYEAGKLSLQTMLLGGEPGSENTDEDYQYYIYDGSSTQTTREKRYIMQKIQNGEKTEYVMDTRFFQYAFAILESVHTQDAEFILRDLKELFSSLGVDVEGNTDTSEEVGQLQWILPDYKPINWDPMSNTTETQLRISSSANADIGFNPNLDVVIPATGKIVRILKDENKNENENENKNEDTQTVVIEFTGQDDEKLKGITIYISGITVDSSVQVDNTYERGTKIGTTTNNDITIIMKDKNQSVITNVDNYLHPDTQENA